jgi:hypothetical protein
VWTIGAQIWLLNWLHPCLCQQAPDLKLAERAPHKEKVRSSVSL